MDIRHLIRQKSYEHVRYVLRRHPFTFLPYIALLLILLVLPIIVYFLLENTVPQVFSGERIYTTLVLVASVYYLSVCLFFFAHFVDYYLDMWIVTNDRIVDIEQFGLLSRTISELDLFRVQDVTTDVHGFFATFLNYGDVSVKTASENIDIVFRQVPNPNHIRHELLRLSDEDKKYHYHEMADKAVNEM